MDEMTEEQRKESRRFTARGVVKTRGHEGEPIYHFSLFVDDVKTATYDDDDWGGPARWGVLDEKRYAQFTAFCESLPPIEDFGFVFPMDADYYTNTLLQRYVIKRDIARDMKNGLVYRTPSSPPGSHYVQKFGYGEDVAALRSALAEQEGAHLFAHENLEAFIDDIMKGWTI